MTNQQRIVLLDSSGVLHRCFHGYPARPSTLHGYGVEIAAVRGYLEYVRKLTKDIAYDRLVHVLDGPGGSNYRYGIYPQYKSGRTPGHPALTAQLAMLSPLLRAFGQEVACVRGVESDDLMAIMARDFAKNGHMTLIASTDKDLLQLVEGNTINVALYRKVDGYKAHDFIQEAEVFEKMGVRPDQIADFLALKGDEVDGFPGAANVGEKGAAKLLQEFGDLATILTQAHTIKGKLGEHIRAAAADLPLYRQLATVMTEIPNTEIHQFYVKDTMDEKDAQALRACVRPDPSWPDDLVSDFFEDAPVEARSVYRP
jgi:DNA polymerase-1